MRWIDDCKCILSNVEGTNSLPMRKMEKGMLSTPWIDRVCLIISILLAYFSSPLMSNYIKEYLGDNSDIFSFCSIMSLFRALLCNFMVLYADLKSLRDSSVSCIKFDKALTLSLYESARLSSFRAVFKSLSIVCV